MKDLLLEIGMEEIPAKFMPPALAQLAQLAADRFAAERLTYEQIQTWGTPRRLTLYVSGLAEMQQDLEEEIKGPALKAAYDAEGNPTKAAQGFARSQGVDVATLVTKELGNGTYVFAVKRAAGRPAAEVLPQILPELIHGLHFPKPMRWGSTEMRYGRPIRWIVALFDQQVIPFVIENIPSGQVSRGHRFLGSQALTIPAADQYLALMADNYVIVDQKRREAMILEQIQALAASVEGEAQIDADLLEEVVYLVEYPTALMGDFKPSYLVLPEQLVITPMKEHQRYFPVLKGHHLLPKFITVRNGGSDHLDVVQAGNEKVLEARLADARFFYEEDLKVNLWDNVPKLKTIVFQEKLGTMHDKVERVKQGVTEIAKLLNLGAEAQARALRAASLCKADLVSNVVYEFPELQGIIGEKYAFATANEHPLTAKAVPEHYLPRFAGDELPLTFEGLACSAADKMDTITGCFAVGIEPTGSQDPYALRRQAAGICAMIVGRGVLVSLQALIGQAVDHLPSHLVTDREGLVRKVYGFFEQRVRNILSDEGCGFDVVEAIIAAGYDNVTEAVLRGKALQGFKGSLSYDKMMTVFTRANNLAKKAETTEIVEGALADDSEKLLWSDIQFAEKAIAKYITERAYAEGLMVISTLEDSVNGFFDAVMVMDEDETVRSNRLALLKRFSQLGDAIADLSKVV